jgi:hypothetical protein
MNALTTTGQHALRPQNFGELMEFAKMAARSSMVPRDYIGKPENILIAIQMGSEIGLSPMQSLQNISVINGRPTLWGDAMLGLCRQSPVCKDVVERFEGEGKELTAICVAKRVGSEPIEVRFSMDDADRAGLASKPGTWQQYPKRMLQMRARGFALRDAFPDVLRGMISTEEAQDIPEDKFKGQTIEADRPDARDAMNADIPLKAAAAATPRGARIAERAPAYEASPKPERTDDQWRAWLDKLAAACSTLYSRSDVADLGGKATVGDALATGPQWVQAEISKILAENYARFPEEDQPEEPDPDLEIVGEKYAAG